MAVRDQARPMLASIDETSELSHPFAVTAWALGLALRHLRDLDESAQWLRIACDGLDGCADDHTGASLTLAGTLAFQGELAEAANVLNSTNAPAELHGRVEYQRAAIAERRGDLGDAQDGYQAALAAFEHVGDTLGEAHSLVGLGLLDVSAGRASVAIVRFGLARSLYAELDLPMLAALARNNLGYAATRAGDLVAALDHLDGSARELAALGEPFAETALDYVEALLAIGRIDDAADHASTALDTITRAGAETDRAELLVALGRALAANGHPTIADRAFATAASLFDKQDRPAWSSIVRLRMLESSRESADIVCDKLIIERDRLRSLEFFDEAADADSRIVESADHLDRTDDLFAAIANLDELADGDVRREYGCCVRLQREGHHEAAARRASRSVIACSVEVADGALLDARFGLLKQRERVVRVARRSAQIADRPDLIVDIAAAAQHLLLRPPGSPRGHQSPPPISDALRSQNTPATWRKISVGQLAETSDRSSTDSVETDEVIGPESIVVAFDDGEQLCFVHAADDVVTFLEAPPRDRLVDAIRRHQYVLAAGQSELLSHDNALDATAQVVRGMLPWLTDLAGELVVAPTGALLTAPWSSICDRPVHVVVDFRRSLAERHNQTTVLTGPNLDSSTAERANIGQVVELSRHSDVRTPANALDQARGAILHLCCHGIHDPNNPLLSRYDLDLGPLTGYDIESAAHVPSLVIAAACRAGHLEQRGKLSAIGLPTAWIAAGADTVIAPNCAIPDDDRTVRTMTELHRGLARGMSAASAVFKARDGDPVVARALNAVGRRPPPQTPAAI